MRQRLILFLFLATLSGVFHAYTVANTVYKVAIVFDGMCAHAANAKRRSKANSFIEEAKSKYDGIGDCNQPLSLINCICGLNEERKNGRE